MSLRVVISRSIGETRLEDWSQVCDPASDLLMHPGLLEAAEASMGPGTAGARASGCETLFWYLLAYRDGEPLGAACVTEYPLDSMVLASPLAHWVVGHVRRWWPRYLKFRVTFCGLPISIAGSNIRLAPNAEPGATIHALNHAIEQISRERKTLVVVYKELDPDETAACEVLKEVGFVRGDSLPMNRIANDFGSFDAMLAAMRSHYRYKILRSRKKFASSGLKVTRLGGPAAIGQAYTPALHALYEQVTRRAEHRLEILPREFFLELAARFPNELTLTTISQGARTVGFAWSMPFGETYRNLFVGIDYDVSTETDAYFNLMLEDTAHALSSGSREVYIGQSADDFKSRLGCIGEPRYLYIKVTNGVLRWWFRRFASSFLKPVPPAPRRNVFRENSPAAEVSRSRSPHVDRT